MQTGCDAQTPLLHFLKGAQIIVDHEQHFTPSERCFFNEKRSRKESGEVQNKASNMQLKCLTQVLSQIFAKNPPNQIRLTYWKANYLGQDVYEDDLPVD